jgi:hypothetical protein
MDFAMKVDFMSEFMRLDAKAPATLGAVVEAVAHLSTLSEAQILELVSAGRIGELFPFKPAADEPIPSDTVADEDLVVASAAPLTRKQRDALIESSLPARSPRKYRTRSASKR